MPALVPEVDVHPVVDVPYMNSAAWINQEDVVISGMSGRLPEANSIDEFKQKLYDGVDMVTDDERRWPAGEFVLPVLLYPVEKFCFWPFWKVSMNDKNCQSMRKAWKSRVPPSSENYI